MLTPGSRLGILGQNGAGKSTLIRTLMKKEEPTTGTIKHADHLKISYFDQTREALNPELTVMKTLCPDGDHVEFNGMRTHIRSYLDRFLFSSSQMAMKVGQLSGGEQSRMLVAKLMLTSANLLILDEPTNDLDMATLNVLEQCLIDFKGAIILVTHDRYFLDAVATSLLAFPPSFYPNKDLITFANFLQWEEWVGQLNPQTDEVALKKKNVDKSSKVKLSFNQQRELDQMEPTIASLEKKLEELNTQSTQKENISNSSLLQSLATDMAQIQDELDRMYKRWSELEAINQ